MLTENDYLELYTTCKLADDPVKTRELDRVCKITLANEVVYRTVERFVSVPWPVIAAIHSQESNQNFTRHLHNGDPLTGKTIRVPKGRPEKGVPPFTWIESATDALSGLWLPKAWTVAGWLEFAERFNGLGYQKHGVCSPYLWGFTDKYTKGLYVADGKFDPNKADAGPGVVALVKTFEAKGVSLDFSRLGARGGPLH